MMTRASLSLVISTMLTILMLCPAAAKADLSDGLVAHWEFDEGTGSTAYDSAGDNDGTINGPLWTSGQINGALNFDGSNDRVEIGDKFNDLAVPFSISAWIRKDSNGAMGLFSSDDVETPFTGNYYGFWFFLDDQEVAIGYGDGSGSGPPERRSKRSGPVIENDQWTMVTAVVNGPTDMSIYVDGTDVGGTHSGTGGDMVHNSRNARIGLVTTMWGYFPFNGLIDDVRIYDRALSSEEISELYENTFDPLAGAINQIQGTLFEKLEVIEIIAGALEKEQAAIDTLEEILESGDYGELKKADLVKAKQKIHSASQHQDQAIHQIEESIDKLQDSLDALGYVPPEE